MAEKKIQGTSNQHVQKSEKAQNGLFHSGSTANRLAEEYKVSRNTIKRDEKLAEALIKIGEASPEGAEAKIKILSGEMPVNKSKLEALSSAPPEKMKDFVAEIKDGTYNRRTVSNARREEINSIMESFP